MGNVGGNIQVGPADVAGHGVRGSRVSPHQSEGHHKALSIPETRGQFFFFQFLNIGPTWAVEEVKG